MHITKQHYAEMRELAQAAGYLDIDLTSHQTMGGGCLYTAMVHTRHANCRMLAMGLPAYTPLEEFLHAVRQELLAMAPVTYTMVGEAYRIAA